MDALYSGFDPLSVTFLGTVAIELDRDLLKMRACRRIVEDTDLGFQPRGFGAGIESPFRKGRLLYCFVRAADLDEIKLVEAQFISNLADVEKKARRGSPVNRISCRGSFAASTSLSSD